MWRGRCSYRECQRHPRARFHKQPLIAVICLCRRVSVDFYETEKALTKTSQVGEFGGVVGHRAHDPVSSCLPHGVEDATDDIQKDTADIRPVINIQLGAIAGLLCDRRTGVLPRYVKCQSPNTHARMRRLPLTFDRSTPRCERRTPSRRARTSPRTRGTGA